MLSCEGREGHAEPVSVEGRWMVGRRRKGLRYLREHERTSLGVDGMQARKKNRLDGPVPA